MPEVSEGKIDFHSTKYQALVKTSLLNLGIDISRAAGNGLPVAESQLSNYLDRLQNLIPLQDNRTKRTLSDNVREWILSTEGIFLSTDVIKELNLSTVGDKKNLSTILGRIAKENLIAKHGDKRGQYRRIDASMQPMDWQSCDVT